MSTSRPKPAAPRLRQLRPSDARAATLLATQATHGLARMAEGVHQAVWNTMGVPGGAAPGQTRGVTGFVYRAVHSITALVGKGLVGALTRLEPLLESLVDAPPETPEREAVLAALNGVLGDRLVETHNPLATPMTLRHLGQALPLTGPRASPLPIAGATGKVLLLIHGLCMNDLQWQAQAREDGQPQSDHARALATERGYTPVYLRYNTGLHTSINGRELAQLLEPLLAHWPVPVQELCVVVHSMGGLVIRAAVHEAQQSQRAWLRHLKTIVFLGTPHHGAPLEKAGNWVDVLLGSNPYSKPFAKLGQLRSAGITDLRFGHVQDADWVGHDRFTKKSDSRHPLPLPTGVACYTVAATTAAQRSPLADRLIGDGLVPLASALGQHRTPARQLAFPPAAQTIVYRTNHMELLHSPAVTQWLLKWLPPSP